MLSPLWSNDLNDELAGKVQSVSTVLDNCFKGGEMIGNIPARPSLLKGPSGERRSFLWLMLIALLALIGSLLPPRVFTPAPLDVPQVETTERTLPPVLGPAAATSQAPAARAYALPPQLAGKPEIIAVRTADSATFEINNGQYARLESTEPIHYQDSSGAWQPIDPRFSTVQGGWRNDTNAVQVSLAQRSSSARIGLQAIGTGWEPDTLLATNRAGQTSVLATLLAEDEAEPGTRSADSRTIRYRYSWNDAAIQDQWQTSLGSAEYTLRLASLPAISGPRPDRLDLRVHLHLRPGTTLQVGGKPAVLPLETREPLQFVGANGATLLLQPPSTYEQRQPHTRIAGSYRISATDDPSVLELLVRTPWEWVAARQRRFPLIIDPVFQISTPTQWRSAFYRNDRTFSDNRYLAPQEVGQFNDGVQRLLIRFDLPPLPPGSRIDKAYLIATPTDVNLLRGDTYQANASLHLLQNNGWISPNVEPLWDQNPLPPGRQSMAFSRGDAQHAATIWDVTSLAPSWLPGCGSSCNTGVMLKLDREFCGECAGFRFANPSTWTDAELKDTQLSSEPDAPFTPPTGGGGIRLLVFYTGPMLTEGAVVDMSENGINLGRGAPPASAPYYGVTHEYKIPPVPSRWQAVVARGIGSTFGNNPPANPGDFTGRELRGSIPLALRSGNDAIQWTDYAPAAPNVSYILLDGRREPAQGRDQRLRVNPISGDPQPFGYDVRLLAEKATLTPALNGSSVTGYSFDTGDPMALWNIQLPAGSNSRIDIEIQNSNNNYNDLNRLNRFSSEFDAQLLPAGNNAFPQPNTPSVRNLAVAPPSSVTYLKRLTSGIFTAQAANYALALTYKGPRLDVGYEIGPRIGPEAVDGIARMTFGYSVRVTSCSAGEGRFPTALGVCQFVRCPDSSFQAANYREKDRLGLWSASGWDNLGNNAKSIEGNFAPMIGGTSKVAPKVFVVGGNIYMGGPSTPFLSDLSSVMLADCGSPSNASNPIPRLFQVWEGTLRGQIGADRATLVPPAIPVKGPYIDPWQASDRAGGDLSNELFVVDPYQGIGIGSAVLRRQIGVDFAFATVWIVDVNGWPSLNTVISRADTSAINTSFAGLDVYAGFRFSLDTDPAGCATCPRMYRAVRGQDGTVTQPPSLGGASKPVQVLFLPRGVPLPTTPAQRCPASCLDLRALDDTPDRPNRTWALPDVHTNGQAGMIAFSAPGRVTAYSVDHPAADPQAVRQDFSFDTFGASVSVTQEPCEAGGPNVQVIRGETRMTLPNIGSASDASSLISAGFKLCEASLRNVHMEFKTSVGIPLGNSGLFVTGLSGNVDIYPDYTQIRFGIDMQAAPGGDGGLVKIHGDVTLDTRGLVAFEGKFALLNGVLGGQGNLWVSWNPLDIGFKLQACYPYSNGSQNPCEDSWLSGMMRAHLWQGQGWQHRYPWLPDNDEKHAAAEISASITIKKGQIFSWWFIDIPPSNVNLGVTLAFGQFCTNRSCTQYEWGIKGKLTILDYDIGLYYGLDKGFDFILGNDDHVLIDQVNGAQDVPLLAAEAAARPQVRRAAQAVNGSATEDFTVGADAESLLFALGWQAGAPKLTLIRPDGVEITPANASTQGAAVATTANSTMFGVKSPSRGVWKARVSDVSTDRREHYKLVYFANHGAPGKPGNAGTFLAPVQADEDGTGTYTITWSLPADTPASATISLYYIWTPVNGDRGTIPGNLGDLTPLVKNLPFRQGTYVWNTAALENGTYTLRAEVDDGVNALPQVVEPADSCSVVGDELPSARAFAANRFPGTIVFTSTGTVQIMDFDVPAAVPTGLELSGIDGAILARWQPVADQKITTYLVRWGRKYGDFIEWKNQERVTATEQPSLRIGGLTNDLEYGVDVAAIQVNGNQGASSASAAATPSANATPIPPTPTQFGYVDVFPDSATFAWAAAPGATGYRLSFVRLGTNGQSGSIDTAATSGTLTGLVPGATYDARVSAANAAGWYSAPSLPLRFVATDGDGSGDGMPDAWAAAYTLTDPQGDDDGDGLTNIREYDLGTIPRSQDGDGDGFSDAEEVAAETDPLDGGSFGSALTLPRLALSEDRLIFRAKRPAGAAIPAQSVVWSNTGGGTLRLQAIGTAAWLKPSLVGDKVQVGVDIAGLQAGFYNGVVRVLPAAGSDALIGAPECIRVALWVSPADDEFPPPTARDKQTYLPLLRRS